MKKTSDLKQFHQMLNDAFYEIEREEDFPNYFYDAFLNGDVEVYQKQIEEIKTFHEDWIGTIESFFPSLDKITKDPKSGLRYEQNVTAIEKAKKTNKDSVRHLSQNTHLIKEIRGDDVLPKGILTTQAEIEYAIYENRFIKTLVDRLFDFVQRRYELVKRNVDDTDSKHFNLKSKFEIRGTEAELEINVLTKDVKEQVESKESNYKLLSRINHLLKQVSGLRVSPFMLGLKDARPVIPPIMKTSILLKNVDYKNCYNLWIYLDKYHTMDFDLEVKEKNLTFDRYFTKNIYQMALTNFSYIYGNQTILEDHYQYLDTKEYRRKSIQVIKKTLDELLSSDEAHEMEGSLINQYFLEQNKELFKKKLDLNLVELPNFDLALKKTLKETMAITDALTQGFFELDHVLSEEDIFSGSGFKKKTDEDDIEAMKKKIRIAKIIRETKEVDYNNQIRFERKLMRELDEMNKEYLRHKTRKLKDDEEKLRLEELIKLERQQLESNQEMLRNHLETVYALRDEMASIHQSTLEEIKKYREEVKAKEKKKIDEERLKAKKIHQQKQKEIKAQQKKELDKEKKALVLQKKKDQEKLKKEKQKIDTQSKARTKKALDKIKK